MAPRDVSPLVARDVSKAYGARVVLDGVDLVAGVEPADSGTVARPRYLTYVGQEAGFADGATVGSVLDEALAPLHDEPTNHISLTLAEELEDALRRSAGTVVLASHDRWLRRRWEGPTLGL